ncbi:MAG TPA: hypothetical protein VFH88_08660 [Candidatus Krumholzibacteria bacterium]|nr:hypothetical protein [Candidatus Krumholzibacteria bacterium]
MTAAAIAYAEIERARPDLIDKMGLQKKCGTVEKYFSDGLGIDAAHQKALRDLYVKKWTR